MNQGAVVEFSHVSQDIENIRVLSDVSFRIGAGERWTIVGPNGSGKTTLLKIINGYLRPSRGRVEVLGGALGETSLPELRKRSGFVSSYLDNLLVSDDNVLDVVVSGRYGATRLWEIPPIGEVNKGKKILRELGCLRFESRKLSELSQGERQKVLIGRSLMANPALLTFDEPCAPLDLGFEGGVFERNQCDRQGSENSLYDLHHAPDRRDPSVFYEGFTIEKRQGSGTGSHRKGTHQQKPKQLFWVGRGGKALEGKALSRGRHVNTSSNEKRPFWEL